MIQSIQEAVKRKRINWKDENKRLQLIGEFGTQSNIYSSVIDVRNHGHRTLPIYPFDEYSMHYVMFYQSFPIGSLTTPRCCDGKIDCEEFYPPALIKRLGHLIVSACKFRIKPNPNSGMFLLRLMIREAWRDQLKAGARLDVINVERKLIPFYRRIGYVVVEGSDFIHPTLGTDSVVLVLPADPNRRSFCQDLFAEVSDPLLFEEVQDVLGPTIPTQPR